MSKNLHKFYCISRPHRLLQDGLLAGAQRHPEKIALIVEGRPYTYSQLLDHALRLAAAFKKRDLRRGDRVAIYMDNTWPCIVSIYATLIVGGVFLIINPQTKSDKLEFILNDSDAAILMTDAHLSNVYSAAVQNTLKISHIIASGDLTGKSLEKIAVESFDSVIENTGVLETPVEVIPNELAALIYTSGSAGFPKGVMQTHQSMVFAAWSLIEYLRLSEEDRILLVLPIAFDYGLYQVLMAIKLGAILIVERTFAFPAQVYQRIDKCKVTVFPGVPTIFSIIVSSHKKNSLCFPSIKTITNTAAALPVEIVPYLQEIFPNALIFKMYGLTECKRVSYLEPELVNVKPTSVGKAIPGTEVFLRSPDGLPVAPGGEGILYVRGPHLMAGYWKRQDLTEQMLKPGSLPGERVLCTQDIFRMDEEGYLYFIGRSDDIIKTRGEKVSPVEVENVIHAIRGVKEVAVIGVTDPVTGEAIRAFVVVEDGFVLDDKKIKRECVVRLENFMVPRDVVILDSMPKTPNGKIDKQRLVSLSTD